MKILMIIVIIVAIILSIIFIDDKPKIANFDDCINAGNPAMDSYPRQCKDPLSEESFVEIIPTWKFNGVEL